MLIEYTTISFILMFSTWFFYHFRIPIGCILTAMMGLLILSELISGLGFPLAFIPILANIIQWLIVIKSWKN